MLTIFLLLFPAVGNAVQTESSQFLHKTPSADLEKMLTQGGRGIDLDFNVDSQEDSRSEMRRPEVRFAGLEGQPIPLEELRKEQENARFTRSTGPSFDFPIYDFMVPTGHPKNSSVLAVIKFSTSDDSPTTFSVAMDRLKWFEIGRPVKTKRGDRIEYEVPIRLSAGADVRPELTKNSVYKFNVEAVQGEHKFESRIRVEIFSFSPTTKEVVEEKTTGAHSGDIELPSTVATLETTVEGSAEEAEETNDLVLTTSTEVKISVATTTETPKAEKPTTNSMAEPITEEQLLTTAAEENAVIEEGSGELQMPLGKQSSTEQDDEEDPLSEVVTVATPILQKEAKIVEISVAGTKEGVFAVEGTLNRGDMLRGLVVSGKSQSVRFLKVRNGEFQKDTEWLELSTDRSELFVVRPRRIEPGGKAYLFCIHPQFIGDILLTISISDGKTVAEEKITIRKMWSSEESTSAEMKFGVPEDAPSGTVIGKIEHGDQMKVAGRPGLFALVSSDIVLSCPSDAPCLDYETQHVHYLLLLARDGSMKTMRVYIQVLDVNDNTPLIEPTDDFIRISDGRLIMPFAVQILDEDTPAVQSNKLGSSGDAASFLQLEKIDEDLYQARLKGSPAPGRYELALKVHDGVHRSRKTRKTVRVLVQNTRSHAHFRRVRYEHNVTPERIRAGVEVIRVELEGVPIDEARFVILSGNPGWLTVDDYGGTVSFAHPYRTPTAGKYETIVAALDRESGRILAETTVSVSVLGAPTTKKVFEKGLYEKTLDREESPSISIALGIPSASIKISYPSLLAIDENGQRRALKQEAITVRGDKITIDQKAVAALRVIRVDIESEGEKAIVVFHLISSNDFLENRRKMASRPILPPLPEVLDIVEGLPVGHVVTSIPAFHPATGELQSVEMEGGDGYFVLDGVLKLTKKMDFEDEKTPKEVALMFKSGEKGFETIAGMTVRLVDVDDNAPVIDRASLPGKVSIPENLPEGSVVFRVPVSDMDKISLQSGVIASLKGPSKDLFSVRIANETAIIEVAGSLDREQAEQHLLQLVVRDVGGNWDAVTTVVELKDENDNAPEFSKDVYNVLAVENWPAGLVLETLMATDSDSFERGQIAYSLESPNSQFFSLDSSTGELTVSKDLLGLAREAPYLLTATASDGGSPSLNSSVLIRITVSESKRKNDVPLLFQSPPVDFVLQLEGPLQPGEKIYQAKAGVEGDGRNVRYSMKELLINESFFKMDEMSGELMVERSPTRKREHIVSPGAWSSS